MTLVLSVIKDSFIKGLDIYNFSFIEKTNQL